MTESDDGVGDCNIKDCVYELDNPSCTLKLGTGFTLLVLSPRIAKGECAVDKLTEDAFAVIKLFIMVLKPMFDDGICVVGELVSRVGCTEERAGTTLVA